MLAIIIFAFSILLGPVAGRLLSRMNPMGRNERELQWATLKGAYILCGYARTFVKIRICQLPSDLLDDLYMF